MKIQLKNVRLSFPRLWKAEAFAGDDGKPAFSAAFLIPEADPQIKAIETVIANVANEKWGAKAAGILKALEVGGKTCFRSGDTKPDTEGYEGHYFVAARAYTRPLILDRDKSILTEADGRPYGGAYVNASIEIYAQDNTWGKRINASLRGVQFVRDGEAFAGGAPASPDEFEEVDSDELA